MQKQIPALELQNVSMTFPIRQGLLRRLTGNIQAVSNISLQLNPGETLGVVGESGSGKSTLGRIALRLLSPTSGRILHEGRDITNISGRQLRMARARLQMVFQDPYASFDPMAPLSSSVAEPLDARRPRPTSQERTDRLEELIGLVRLRSEHLHRYPRELSGGQLQRLGIARALATNPSLVVLDEPVSALDVSTQAQVINLLAELQSRLQIAYMLISHNPALVRHASKRIAVMYLGEIVEIGDANAVYEQPKHPYTHALLSAVLIPNPEVQRQRQRILLRGEIPNAATPPLGCRFHPRCPHAMDICRTTPPPEFTAPDKTVVRCHLHEHGPRLQGASIATLSSTAVKSG